MRTCSFWVCLIAGAGLASAAEIAPLAVTNAPEPIEHVIFYFHRTARCPTCLGMEQWTREVAETPAGAASARAPVSMRSVNLDLPADEHYVQDFDLTFSTVVLAELRAGQPVRWKNLEAIWDFAHDEARFKEYIQRELATFFTPES